MLVGSAVAAWDKSYDLCKKGTGSKPILGIGSWCEMQRVTGYSNPTNRYSLSAQLLERISGDHSASNVEKEV